MEYARLAHKTEEEFLKSCQALIAPAESKKDEKASAARLFSPAKNPAESTEAKAIAYARQCKMDPHALNALELIKSACTSLDAAKIIMTSEALSRALSEDQLK